MIPQQFIDDLLRRVDVVEIVGQHVQLKKAGANYSGLCPFHAEKSPSFTVSPSKQFYHCFGCGAHGTALGFLIEHLGLPFPQAVEDLARRVGLEVPRQAPVADPEVRKRESDQRARLKDCLLQAARFYQRRLKDSPHAIDYLKGRGLSGEVAVRYHLGYAPEAWQSLQSVFSDYQSRDLLDAGLVIDGESDRRYDRFRDRIMFPILSSRGEVLGFGARTLGADEPKYLNSPETPVFSKGFELYGVFEARQSIREARQLWVVEGYMDVVALAQHGIGHVVATLGTATTAQHLQQCLRLSDRVVFMFDGDAAGRRAAARAMETALPFASEQNRIDFAFLPEEHDPDSFVRAHGAEALREWVSKAMPLSAWLLEVATGGQSLEIAEGRAAAVTEVRRLLSLMAAGPLRNQIALQAARRLDASDLVKDSAPAFARADGKPRGPASLGPVITTGPRFTRPVIRPLGERLLQIIVREPAWARLIDDQVLSALDGPQSALLLWIQQRLPEQGSVNFAMLHEAALAEGRDRGSEAVRFFIRLAQPDAALDALSESTQLLREEFNLTLVRLKLRVLEERAAALADQAGSDPNSRAELQRVRETIQQLKARPPN
ncbi:MAG: DNA primase [Betaproteobacteria bacterium]|jgi:DNA primase|nr:DNA primase [Betaproteobacteria bacterium]